MLDGDLDSFIQDMRNKGRWLWVLYPLLPFIVMGLLVPLSRNPKRRVSVRRASAMTFWTILLLSLAFYLLFTTELAQPPRGSDQSGGIALLVAPVWAIGLMIGLWLMSYVFFVCMTRLR